MIPMVICNDFINIIYQLFTMKDSE